MQGRQAHFFATVTRYSSLGESHTTMRFIFDLLGLQQLHVSNSPPAKRGLDSDAQTPLQPFVLICCLPHPLVVTNLVISCDTQRERPLTSTSPMIRKRRTANSTALFFILNFRLQRNNQSLKRFLVCGSHVVLVSCPPFVHQQLDLCHFELCF